MSSYQWAFICILIAILVAGCTGSTSAPAVDPLAGSWTNDSPYNNTTITSTLVFNQDGNFNGYMLGMLTLSGHWTKINATAYDVYYGNAAHVFILNNDKTQLWDGNAPQQLFTKQ